MSALTFFKVKAIGGGSSPAYQAQAPFCVGQPFKMGDVPAGHTLTTTDATLQVTVKNRFPDGSIRFAILCGTVNVSSSSTGLVNGWRTVSLQVVPASGSPPPAPLTLADFKARVTGGMTIGADTFGSASFGSADFDAPFITHVTGPLMSSWVFKKQIGTDAHLTAWLEVRVYSGGMTDVLPWVENATLSVPNPVSKSAVYTFSVGGVTRFTRTIDLPARCRTPLVEGTGVSHWIGLAGGAYTDLAVQHERAYVEVTGAVPRYMVTMPGSAPAAQNLPTTFVPLQRGSLVDTMGTAGADETIGLLTRGDTACLICPDVAEKAWKAIQFNSYSAGRYGFHFRDETTGRALIYTSYPYRCLPDPGVGIWGGSSSRGDYCPTATGTHPIQFTWSHHPRLYYLGYLTSGRWFHADGLQIMMGTVYLSASDSGRDYTKGLVRGEHQAYAVRGAAWIYATLAAAIYCSPDDDPVPAIRQQFLDQVKHSFLDLRQRYCRPGTNPLGAVNGTPDHGGENMFGASIWQQDFSQQSIGWLLSMNLPLSTEARSDTEQFFAWIGKSVVGRLGAHDDPTTFFFAHAQGYFIATRPTDAEQSYWQETEGPFYANWGEAYVDYFARAAEPLGPRTADSPIKTRLDGEGYLAILVGALAYCRQFNIPGAEASWQRLSAASNWHISVNDYATKPNFALMPLYTPTSPVPLPPPPTTPPPATQQTGRGPTIRFKPPAGLSAQHLVIGMAGNGRLGSLVPTTGANGPGVLYPSLDLPLDANAEVRVMPVEKPTGLTAFTVFPNGAVQAEGPKGTYRMSFRVYREGVVVGGTAYATIHIDTTPLLNGRHRLYARRR